MNFVERLPKLEGADTLLVVVDKLTKFSHFLTLAHPFTATEVARTLMDSVFRIHGLLKVVVFDRDKVFTSQFRKALFQGLGIKLHLSSAYHLEIDGQTERVNQCLETYLRCLCVSKPRSWSRWVALPNGGITPTIVQHVKEPLSKLYLGTCLPSSRL